jgi:hypothetical protein
MGFFGSPSGMFETAGGVVFLVYDPDDPMLLNRAGSDSI